MKGVSICLPPIRIATVEFDERLVAVGNGIKANVFSTFQKVGKIGCIWPNHKR